MAESRLVPSNLMSWPKVRSLVPDMKLLVYHLWAISPSSAGAWLLDLGAVASATNLSEVAILEALKDFGSRGISMYDQETGEIFVLDWYRFHKFAKQSQKECLHRDIQKIQSLWIKNTVFQKINDIAPNQTQPITNLTHQTSKQTENVVRHTIKTTSPSDPDVLMANAVVHCEIHIRRKEIKNPTGLFLKIHSRIKMDGPSAQDMEDLQTYREFLGAEEAA
jgi:hypothetical protein